MYCHIYFSWDLSSILIIFSNVLLDPPFPMNKIVSSSSLSLKGALHFLYFINGHLTRKLVNIALY